MLRSDDRDWGERRLCLFTALRSRLRCMVAVCGRDGCVVLLMYVEKAAAAVVGSWNAKGMASM